MGKLTICLDFDGVVNSYSSGWTGAGSIPDLPVDGAIEAILEYMKTFTVCIHSSRFNRTNFLHEIEVAHFESPRRTVRDWLVINGVPLGQIALNGDMLMDNPPDNMILLCRTKPPAFVTIDDRAIMFTGEWPSVETIKSFKPWNKK